MAQHHGRTLSCGVEIQALGRKKGKHLSVWATVLQLDDTEGCWLPGSSLPVCAVLWALRTASTDNTQ